MNIDPNSTIFDREGLQVVPLKAALLHLLDNASPGEREAARRYGRLADKISDSNGDMDLEDSEIKDIRQAIDADKGMKVWALEGLEYRLWPSELAESDLERLNKRYER